MLRQPSFPMSQDTAEPECQALFPEQAVAAVSAAKRADFIAFRQMCNNNLLGITGPAVDDWTYKYKQQTALFKRRNCVSAHFGCCDLTAMPG